MARRRTARERIIDAARQTHAVKSEQKYLTDRYNKLKDSLFDLLMEHGDEDDKGSLNVDFGEAVDGLTGVTLRKAVRKPKLDDGALERLLKEKGIWDDCLTPQLDVAKVKDAIYRGKLSEADFDACLTHQEPTFGLYLNEAKA